tara:strand:+ start:45394 stop:46308 length:915 start_codon:yes stop_codon:yes gene_type:complete
LNDDETESSDNHRQRNIERLIIIGAIAGPILLVIGAYLRGRGYDDVSSALAGLSQSAITWVSRTVIEMLMIWVAWRSPPLGGHVVRGLIFIIGLLAMATLIEWYPMRTTAFGSLPPRVLVASLVYQRCVPFLIGVLSLVIARRALGIRLVRPSSECDRASLPLSIRELMLWTFVIALAFAFIHHVTQWFQSLQYAASNQLPWWYPIYFLVSHLPSWGFLVVSLAYLHWTQRWRWLPLVIVVYATLAMAVAWVNAIVIDTYFGGIRSDLLTWSSVFRILISLAPTLVATWLLRLAGLRFVCPTRG